LTEKRLKQEYTELMEEWTAAEDAPQRVADRLRKLDGPLAINDPMWEDWDHADEKAGHAREAVRSFLAANGRSWGP
jgi:hypothetical protein